MSNGDIYYRERVGSGLYGLFTDSGRQLWTRRKLRKRTKCEACGRVLAVGAAGYGPVTNASNRMWRLCPPCVEDK